MISVCYLDSAQGKKPPAFKLHIFLTRMHQMGSKYPAIETL